MFAFVDFRCSDCEKIIPDVEFKSGDFPPKAVDCPGCGNTVSERFYGNHQLMDCFNPSMYGKMHLGFGEVCNSYMHKKELMKKYNLREAADPVGGSRHIDSSDQQSRTTKEASFGNPFWADSPKDLEIQQEKQAEKIYGEVHDFTSQGGRLGDDVL